MLTLAGVPQRVVMELMRHSDMQLTAKTYTDAGMLPVDATITKLPSLNGAVNPAPQMAPQSLVQARPALSLVVHETEVPHLAGTRMNTGFERALARLLSMNVPRCPKVRDGARCRVRTGRTPIEHQALVKVHSPYCAPGAEKGLGADLGEVIAAWPLLADPLKAAVLGIVRSVATGLRVAGKEGK